MWSLPFREGRGCWVFPHLSTEVVRLQENPGELPQSRWGTWTLQVAFPPSRIGAQFAPGEWQHWGLFSVVLFFSFLHYADFPTEVPFSSSLKSSWHLHLQNMENGGKGWVFLFTSKAKPFLANSCSTSWSTQLTFIIVFPGTNVKKTFFLLLKTWKAGYRIWKNVWNCSTASDINCLSTYITMYRVSLYHCFQAFPLILFMVQKQIN